jgi:hypothetical protein
MRSRLATSIAVSLLLFWIRHFFIAHVLRFFVCFYLTNSLIIIVITRFRCLYLHLLGCCCDSRRAVMIYSIIYLILAVIAIAVYAAMARGYVWTLDGVTVQSGVPTLTFVILGVSIAVLILTLVGAAIYNKWMVGIGAVWEIIFVILSIVQALTGPSTFISSDGSTTITVSPGASIISALIFSGLIFYVSC